MKRETEALILKALTNNLTESLRYCGVQERCDKNTAKGCPYSHHWTSGEDCEGMLLEQAAETIEWLIKEHGNEQ